MRFNPLASSHLEMGKSNIARSALMASGIKNCLAKYSPLIAKKAKKMMDIILGREGGETNIINQVRSLKDSLKYFQDGFFTRIFLIPLSDYKFYIVLERLVHF